MAKTVFDASQVSNALDTMAAAISGNELFLIGIQRGGAKVADALQQRLEAGGATIHRGNLDISFYRDDLDTIGPNPQVRPSHIPFDLTGKQLWLVDDVLYTGRTIRAALGEIFDYGRPASVKLAVLVDRGGRELPVQPDVAGISYPAQTGTSVKLVMEEEKWTIEQRQVK